MCKHTHPPKACNVAFTNRTTPRRWPWTFCYRICMHSEVYHLRALSNSATTTKHLSLRRGDRLCVVSWILPQHLACPERCGEAMEAAVRRRRPRPEERSAADGERPPALSGQSYWLDLWLFVLFDVALFVFIYLLPWWAWPRATWITGFTGESLDAPYEHKQDRLKEEHLHSIDNNGERDFPLMERQEAPWAGEMGACCIAVHPGMYYEYCL